MQQDTISTHELTPLWILPSVNRLHYNPNSLNTCAESIAVPEEVAIGVEESSLPVQSWG